MRILIAPQEFKGSLNAEEAADAIAAGIRGAQPDWTLDLLPFADGGPGFIDALRRAVRADTRGTTVRDPLGRAVLGRYLVVRGSGEAIVEAAQANGLAHVREGERDALRASTEGVGDLIAAALGEEPPRLIVGVGGSVTSDGGAGMATALGARLLDAAGKPVGPGGAGLLELEHIEWNRPEVLPGVVVATDVTNPLSGAEGAARVFGPQKGATPGQVAALERGLERYATVVRHDLGVDVRDVPGGGAAGGLAAGLVAFLGATIESGFDVVAEATGLASRIERADLVITGEGSYDAQSAGGKGPARIMAMAAEAEKPCLVMAGRSDLVGQTVRTLAELEPDAGRSMVKAEPLLVELSRRWAAAYEG